MLVSLAAAAQPVEVNLPAQPLADSLKQFARQAKVSVAFDSSLVEGKKAPALHGRWEMLEAFRRLLAGSGLRVEMEGDTAVVSRAREGKTTVVVDEVKVRARKFKQVGPTPGLALSKEEIAGNVQSITAKEIQESHSLSLADLMNTKLQSVNVNDYQGNPFQMDVSYRGFTASPQLGTPQGLSVFLDGIRVNEPFGDVVNWDLIPMNALAGMDVFPGSNPLFGLNTLGGAIAVRTKSGFDKIGGSAEVLNGDFGRRQFVADGSWNNGKVAAFGAANLFMEDGWRVNSPTKVNQLFGKLEWQSERASLALSSLVVVNTMVGNGTLPVEMAAVDPTANFTSPDETRNTLKQFQLSGIFDATDTFSVTGQVYRRNSNRHANTGDIIDKETFRETGSATRRAAPGETIVCAFEDANGDKLPDYYVELRDAAGQPATPYLQSLWAGTPDRSLLDPTTLNQALPAYYLNAAQAFETSGGGKNYPKLNWPQGASLDGSLVEWQYIGGAKYDDTENNFYLDTDPNSPTFGYTKVLISKRPINQASCMNNRVAVNGQGDRLLALGPDGTPKDIRRDGFAGSGSVYRGQGYIDGTPTAVINDSNIQQQVQGAAFQLNWNLDKHKFMLGASIDSAGSTYVGKQRFGLLDADRNVYSAPDEIGEEFEAGAHDVTINDFDGVNQTKSLYLSETWSPTDTLHLAFSGRYNHTTTRNTLAPIRNRAGNEELTLAGANFHNYWAEYAVCTDPNDLSTCNYDLSHPLYDPKNNMLPEHTERFTYRSFNPALGATWQATPRLNLYANWNQGTRVPSVLELGCAFDDTPTPVYGAGGVLIGYRPRSLVINNACTLPTALSGDPYLPQVKARTIEAGARGRFSSLLEWNFSAYRTGLEDDIYLVGVTPELSFFQDIGRTRRQGIEFGLSGEYGRSDFKANYSLVDATFQTTFNMLSPNNSSRDVNVGSKTYDMITVQPGDYLPGMPLNNLNLSWGYKLTPKWKTRLNLVAHSGSFVRGNENNSHTMGPGRTYTTRIYNPSTGQGENVTVKDPDYTTSGRVPGYAVLNFSTSYDLGRGWTLGATVNNLLDKRYYTAGRLGENPFAPSTRGLIGASGFNYNSSEWLGTQFVSTGAPRGVWFTLSYEFDADKRPSVPSKSELINDSEWARQPAPSAPEAIPDSVLDKVAGLPVVKGLAGRGEQLLAQAGSTNSLSADERAVAEAVERWRLALQERKPDAYLQSYAPDYVGENAASRAAWEAQIRAELAQAGGSPRLDRLVVSAQGGREVVAVFTLAQGAQATRKVLRFRNIGGRWVIAREQALKPPVRTGAAPQEKAGQAGGEGA